MKFPKFLKIAVVPHAGIFQVNKTNNNRLQITGGSEKEFLELMSKTLNFDYEVFVPDSGAWGEIQNGSWDGAVGMVHRGQADIGMARISLTELRKTVVDFSQTYDINDLTFATPVPGLLPKTKAVLMPFNSSIWWTLIAVIVFFILSFKIVQRNSYSIQRATFKLLGYVLQQPLNIDPRTLSIKVLLLTWLMMIRFIPLLYSSSLLSFLTIPLQEHGIKNIEDLSNRVAQGTYKAFTLSGTAYVQTLKNSPQAAVRGIAEKILENDWFIKPDQEALVNAMADGKTAVLASRNFFERGIQDLLISSNSFYTSNQAIAIRTDFCCSNAIDRFVLKVCAAGLYRKILKDSSFKAQLAQRLKEASSEDLKSKSLTIEDLSGAFILLLAGYGLAIFVYISEITIFRLKGFFITVFLNRD